VIALMLGVVKMILYILIIHVLTQENVPTMMNVKMAIVAQLKVLKGLEYHLVHAN
jgi:hypothetical protein